MIKLEIIRIEVWKEIIIDDIVTNYSISCLGRVRNNITGLIRKSDTTSGYERASLTIKGNTVKKSLHRLVAIAFIPNENKLEKPDVNHIDGDKLNNLVQNLEWVSKSENTIHAYNNNLIPIKVGVESSQCKYSEDDIVRICELIQKRYSISQISKIMNIPKTTIKSIRNRYNWTHMTDKYIFPRVKAYSYKYDKDLKDSITSLIRKGYKTDKIFEELNIDRTTQMRDLIYTIRKNVVRSTTIP